jgi:hypothetical protein
MQRIDRSRVPVNVPQQSYGTRVMRVTIDGDGNVRGN